MSVGPPRATGATREKYEEELKWQLEDLLPVFRGRQGDVESYWRKYRHLDEITPLVSGSVLDVGCGLSTVLFALPSGRKVGIDPLAHEYQRHYDYGDVELIRSTAEKMPFSDNEFDTVFCSNCLDHVDHPRIALSEIRRCLKPGGIFVMTCELFSVDLGVRNVSHPHSFTYQTLEYLFAGLFTVERHWRSPWVGIRRFILGKPETSRREWIGVMR